MDFLNYLSSLYQQSPALASGLHSWLSSLSAPSMSGGMPGGMNMLTAFPTAPGARLQSPTVYPAGSQQLTPGGTPDTSTPVGGQPAAPSFWDAGPQGYPMPRAHGMSPMLSFPQQWLAAMAGPGQSAAESATAAALQRAAAYRASLFGS